MSIVTNIIRFDHRFQPMLHDSIIIWSQYFIARPSFKADITLYGCCLEPMLCTTAVIWSLYYLEQSSLENDITQNSRYSLTIVSATAKFSVTVVFFQGSSFLYLTMLHCCHGVFIKSYCNIYTVTVSWKLLYFSEKPVNK